MIGREGQLSIEGDRAVLRFERRLPYPPAAVWSALTEPSHRDRWMGKSSIEPREGGAIETVASGPQLPPDMKRMTGRILVWDPPHVLEHEWHQPIVEPGVVRYELHPDGETGTLLQFTHSGLGVPNATGFRPGTQAFLDRLEAHLAGDPLPNWAERYREIAGIPPTYLPTYLPMRGKQMSDNHSDGAPVLAIAYHSGFGHTSALAEAVAAGARAGGAAVSVIAVDAITDADWDLLDRADGIIFGSATYMGNVSGGFQAFAEKTGRRCLEEVWRDKVAAGFTNSGAKSGDKLSALMSLAVFAAQHHMHWVNLGLGAGWNSTSGSENDLNRLGFWLGAGAQTDVDANPDQMHPADVATCEHLGHRVAVITRQMVAGRAVSPGNSTQPNSAASSLAAS